MSKKRRVFDIDLPEELNDETFPAGKVAAPETKSAGAPRRGPMATAIGDTRRSGEERATQEQAIRAENDKLAHEHVRLKKLGLITDLIPLDQIVTYMLVRDRLNMRDNELGELKDSISELGLSNPIRVERREDGKYELIQGFRRLSAFRELLVEKQDDFYAHIPAVIIPHGESIDSLYRQMVDENLVRKDISFAEMAMLALNYAADPSTSENDAEKAVAVLFKSANYQKRSYIRSFIRLMDVLGDDLKFYPEIPRSLGLALVAHMEEVSDLGLHVRKQLKNFEDRTAENELSILRAALDYDGSAELGTLRTRKGATVKARKAKSVFSLSRPEGAAKCTASSGRLDIRLDKDFSTVDRRRLEAAVGRLLDDLS